VAVDRDETLKKAEKLLKQGKLAGAIEEYVRLVEDRPNDWNTANTLGDLYVKAGNMDKAAEQFRNVGDHLFGEGFLPRASAVYKKVLKVRSDDDHSLWQLAEIASRNGLGVDARAYYGRLIKDRRAAGNERGVTDCIVRLGMLEDADLEARATAAHALVQLGEVRQAARVMFGAFELLTREGRHTEALDALREASRLNPEDVEIQQKLTEQGPDQAKEVHEVQAEPIEPIEPVEPVEPVEPAAPPEPLILDSVFEALEAQVTRGQGGQSGDEEP